MKRSISSAIVAVALLAGVACSSAGGGLTPQTGAKITLPTPKSVSPAAIKVAPMASTAIEPASAMLARRPATAANPASWAQIPGEGSEISAAADGSIWVLAAGTGDRAIWHFSGGTWTNISGAASHIAAAPDGTLYAINAGGGVWAYASGSWTPRGGGASSITTASDSSIYVTSNAGSGDQAIWHYAASVWTQAPGSGVSLAGSLETSSHVVGGVTLAPGGTYILNAAGAIYYLNTDGSFAQLPDSASMLASFRGGVFALASGGISPGGNAIYYFDLDTPGWSQQTGAAVSISAGVDGDLYAISGTGAIYQTFAGTPTPAPTASPTQTPSPSPTPTETPTPTPAATPSPIPAYVFAGPGDNFQFSGGGSGDLKPFGAYHNIGYTQLAWSQNLNGSGFNLGVYIADDVADTYVNGTPTKFPVDDAVAGATPVIYYQFTNTAAFDLIFTSTPSILVNYLVPFPGATCYLDVYAPNGGGYAWTTTGLTGQPSPSGGSYYLFFTAVYLNNGANLPLPSGVSYDAVSCK